MTGSPPAMPADVRRAAFLGGAAAMLVFALLLSGGSLDGLTERGPFSSDFFDAQAESLLDGRLDVDPAIASIEGFRIGDETHLYFGVVPALLRLPVVAVAGDRFSGQLTQVSMLLALAVALAATAAILWRAGSTWWGDEPPPRAGLLVGAAIAAVGLSTPLLFLAARPIVYHEVELWGAATTLVAVAAALRWWDRRRRRDLALAAVAAAVALNTRASVGLGAVAALGALALVGLVAKRWTWRALPTVALALALPVATYALVNHARFGSWFGVPFDKQVLSEFDADRQAAMEATDGAFFSVEYAPSALATYLRPDGIEPQALFPWVWFRDAPLLVGTPTFDTIDRSASLPSTSPAVFALAVVGSIALARRDRRGPWLPVAAGLCAGLVPTVTIAFIAHRYLADFVPVLVVLAASGLWVVATWSRRRGSRASLPVVAGLALVGFLVTGALALQTQRLVLFPSDADRQGFLGLQHDLDSLLHDRPAPDVEEASSLGRPGSLGEVRILGDCQALYWSDGSTWHLVEAGPGQGWRLRGVVGTRPTTVLAADTWSVRLEPADGGARLVYEATGRRSGPQLDAASGDELELEVWVDPVNRRVRATRDGDEIVLNAWPVDASGDPGPAAGWRSSAPDTPLCEELAGTLRS